MRQVQNDPKHTCGSFSRKIAVETGWFAVAVENSFAGAARPNRNSLCSQEISIF
ncbi:hypothetical protein Z949_1680 [Sulfitobacter guttiformis KCTC 32187]|nr:hypothetical protein Z949_1680 [Sulfitobacter guttiformis KCTC 32187]